MKVQGEQNRVLRATQQQEQAKLTLSQDAVKQKDAIARQRYQDDCVMVVSSNDKTQLTAITEGLPVIDSARNVPLSVGNIVCDSNGLTGGIIAGENPKGHILDYLPDEEREFFEPLLTEKLTEQGLQNPKAQDAPRTQTEIQTQNGIHPQLQNIECGDVAAVIAHTLKPLILTARPRVGKGILTAHAIAQAKQQHGTSVWVIQPKPAPGELGYWKQADRFLGFYVEDYEIDDPAIAEQLTTFFKEWRASPIRPTILIIDELVKIKAMQPTWYKKFLLPQCVVEGSSGETDHRFLWIITVSPLVGDLGMSGGNRSVFDIMTLQTVVTRDHRESFKKSVASLEALPTDEQFKISPVETLVFHSAIGLWAAVPSYPVPQILPGDRV